MALNEIVGKKLAGSAFGEVFDGFPHKHYHIKPVLLSKEEQFFSEKLIEAILGRISLSELAEQFHLSQDFITTFREDIISVVQYNSLLEKIPSSRVSSQLFNSLLKLITKFDFIKNKELFVDVVLQDSVGLKQLAFFFADDSLEELMVNELDNIFVFHKTFGMLKTNFSLSEKTFDSLLQRIAHTIGGEFSSSKPLLDAHLPDGSRVNATFVDISEPPSLTIRKFSSIPITIVDLIADRTLSSELAAFLWLCIDGLEAKVANIIVSGGSATGKTTLLNVLANFIRLDKRIVSIEDTRELALLERKNWIAMEARFSMSENVGMNALLKNALRMRPDRIIVGEVRGAEALTLFTAMDTGHDGTLSSVHANNARETIVRLQEKPMDVPQAMLPLLDLIIVLERKYSTQGGVKRFVSQVAEVSRMDTKVLLGNIYEYDRSSSTVKKADIPSHFFEELAESASMTKNELKQEMRVREEILKWMLKKNIRAPKEVLEIIQTYYYKPQSILEMVSKEN